MKRLTPLMLAAVLGLAACADRNPIASRDPRPAPPAAEPQVQEFVPGQIIVRFRAGVNHLAVTEAHRAVRGEAMRLPRAEILHVPVGEEVRIAQEMAEDPAVEFAEPDYIMKLGPCEVSTSCTLPDGGFFHYKWDLHNTGSLTDAALGWGLVTTGKPDADADWAEAFDYLGGNAFTGSAVIAILDTGIRPTHSAFAGKILAGMRFLGDAQPVTNYTDDHGHGSHVAGIAAALGTTAVPGVGYGANIKLLVAKVCNSAGTCPNSATANAIVWASDNGANVINMSLGAFGGNPDGTGSAAQQAALQYAASKNVLPVCATGNDDGKVNYFGGVGYPARFPECMAVAATSWSDTKASYSNYGPQTEISAPGGDGNTIGHPFSLVLSASHTSNTGYNWRAGTSMATPQVAGLAALLWATGMHDAAQIRARIISTADDLGAPGQDPQFGAGRINIYRALTGVSPDAPPVANAGGPYSGSKGVAVSFNGSGSSDPNGKAITYAWNFGDPASGSNTSSAANPSHTYARAGIYTVSLTVTDASGRTATTSTTATIPNVAPSMSGLPSAVLLPGESYAASGSFSDPDPDSWSATVNYGEGGTQALALSGNAFSIAHTYNSAGSFTVTVTVSDDDGGSGSASAGVTVLTHAQAIQNLQAMAAPFAGLPGIGNSLNSKLDNALKEINRNRPDKAVDHLENFIHHVQNDVSGGKMSAADGAALIAAAQRIIDSIE